MLFLVMGAALLSAQEESAEADLLRPEVVAKVNGEEMDVRAFADWLVRHHGWSHLDRFVELTALRQEADRLGIVIGEEEVEAEIETDIGNGRLLAFLNEHGTLTDSEYPFTTRVWKVGRSAITRSEARTQVPPRLASTRPISVGTMSLVMYAESVRG